ncbi:MAG: 16S rRNA (cytosine(967)-C(5))-methyltransferase RsmB [Firmicutes bacterium]|jgi:16S rRNA (cytosine967-C5)-methyltransferase|nr:16S rRNA (cytosine(967)-C(5))-methyltransferase RsmB [Bacillota bacterium]
MAKDKTARDLALDVLLRIEKTKSYANLLLSPSLAKSTLSAQDKALATELVYGTIRAMGTLDWILQECSHMPLDKLDPPVRMVLRLGAYQLLYTRIPPSAACFESVQQAKRVSHAGSARYVNAVLRRLSREREQIKYPDPLTDPVRYVAVKYSHPEWLVQRWLERFGLEGTMALCEANNQPPPLCLRTNTTLISSNELADYLRVQGFTPLSHHFVPEALYLQGAGAVGSLPGFKDGKFSIQDESSMLVAHALAPQPGERVLDVCAGPGGKTTHLAELLNGCGEIWAMDIHAHKLALIKETSIRLRLTGIHICEGDARELPPEFIGRFHRVLVDAPCSGTGVLRRRPDLRWHKTPEELNKLPKLQLQILSSAATAVIPGGTLVYSTCSIEPEENILVVKEFLSANPDFVLDDLRPELEEFIPEPTLKQGFVELYPHKHKVDGFFLARLKRCEEGSNYDSTGFKKS